MAELTYSVSVFTEGLLSLRSVSLGVLRVDSHRLLEDGIRQELVKKINFALHNGLIFGGKSKVEQNQKLKLQQHNFFRNILKFIFCTFFSESFN